VRKTLTRYNGKNSHNPPNNHFSGCIGTKKSQTRVVLAMGNICGRTKPVHKCVVCQSEDCSQQSGICGQCDFIHAFIIDHGRNALRDITTTHDQRSRPRALSLSLPSGMNLPPPPRPRVTEVRQVWGGEGNSTYNRQQGSGHPTAPPSAPPDYLMDKHAGY
jgi:hypothetical protein